MFVSNREQNEIKNIIKKSKVNVRSDNAEYVLFKIIENLLKEVESLKKKVKDIES